MFLIRLFLIRKTFSEFIKGGVDKVYKVWDNRIVERSSITKLLSTLTTPERRRSGLANIDNSNVCRDAPFQKEMMKWDS